MIVNREHKERNMTPKEIRAFVAMRAIVRHLQHYIEDADGRQVVLYFDSLHPDTDDKTFEDMVTEAVSDIKHAGW